MMSNSGPEETTSSQGSKGTVKWFLLGSIALNLLLVGLIGGAVWSKHSGGPARDFRADFMRTLAEQKQAEVKEILKFHHQDIRPKRRELREQVRVLMRMLRADSFNRSAFDAALNDIATARGELIKKRYKLIADVAEKLSPRERRRFIRRWRRHMRKLRWEQRRLRRQERRELRDAPRSPNDE